MDQKIKNKKKKKNTFKKFLPVTIGAIIGFCVGGLERKLQLGNVTDNIAKACLFFLIAQFIHINIHEFGHFMAGKKLGYKLISYRVSIFAWDNENGKMKFSIKKNKGYGGLCAMLPREGLPLSKQIPYYAAGIALNMLTGIILIPIWMMMKQANPNMRYFVLVTIITAFFIGIYNFIPFMIGGQLSDGKIIWSIWLKKPLVTKFLECDKILAQLAAGYRPKDIEIAEIPEVDPSKGLGIFEVALVLQCYYKSLDCGNIEELARPLEIIEDNIEEIPVYILPGIYYELCYYNAITGDQEKAMLYYKKAQKTLEKDRDVNGQRVKAYMAYYIEQNIPKAKECCYEALKVVSKYPVKGSALMEEALVKKLLEEIED